ncbi:hypothetical protein Patl1_27901 [Pistacia atlantica]|uniref:Uncharacterized protein n=1 Tax=Pistacia atlantica TaxID=434234 RepID=A0ACC1BGC4_9ROSI|nr:hypothetical protein Patl1_27901 [Pistacia atlantica]
MFILKYAIDLKPGEKGFDWPTRKRVAFGAARGLEYLHEHCNPKIIHRDLKAANILLDKNFEAVLGDFGLAKLVDTKLTHVTTQVRRTMGRIAPEYLSTGKASEKTDVFGYGITLLELWKNNSAIQEVHASHIKGKTTFEALLEVVLELVFNLCIGKHVVEIVPSDENGITENMVEMVLEIRVED